MKAWLVSGLALLLASCAKPTAEKTAVRLAIGGQAQLIYLAATLAQELGNYDAEGLAVTLQDFPGGQKSLEALMGGSTDVVCGFYDHTIVMATEGRELTAFVAMLRHPGLVLVSNSASKIEDLRGKIVGVSAAGSSTQFLLNFLLTTRGMKPDDVSVASIGMSATAVAAMTHAKVDAAVMTDPALEIVRKQSPGSKILADTRTAEGTRAIFGVDDYPSAVLYSTAPWVAGHPDAAARLARAIKRTLDWLHSHSAQEIRAKMPAAFRTGDVATDIEGLNSLKAMLSEDGTISKESAEAVRKVLSVSLPKVAAVSVAGTFTNQFVK